MIRKISISIFAFICLNSSMVFGQKKIIYYIPGQGADSRLFSKVLLDTNIYQVRFIKYIQPIKSEKLEQYSHRLASQIDTSQQFYLVGTSLGGMISVEISKFLKPQKTIIISSAKCREELPVRYKFQKNIPIYRFFPATIIKLGAKLLQPLVEPDRNNDREVFKSMLSSKDPIFLKRSIYMITNWSNHCSENKSSIYHIHGTNDHTIPFKNVKSDFCIQGGSHMITLTRASEIQKILLDVLNKKE